MPQCLNPFLPNSNYLRKKKFSILFFSLFIVLSFLYAELIPQFLLDDFTDITSQLVVFCSGILGIPAFYKDNILTISGFKLKMVRECTAIYFIIILTAGILAYPGHALQYKFKGIVFGNLSIILINSLRLIILGIIGANLPSVFNFVHNYLWQGTFVIVVFIIYLIWVERSFFTMPRLRFSGIFLISSAISVFAIGLIIKPYLRLLSEASDKLFLLTQTDLSISDRLMLISKTNGISIIAVGNEILYRASGNIFYYPLSVDVFDSAVFIGLMTASMVLSNGCYIKGIKGILSGIGILILLHLIFISGIGFLMREVGSNELMGNIIWPMRSFSVITPVLLWFFLKNSFQFSVSGCRQLKTNINAKNNVKKSDYEIPLNPPFPKGETTFYSPLWQSRYDSQPRGKRGDFFKH